MLYARDVEATAEFYRRHFGFAVLRLPGDAIVELVAADGGADIMVHQAAKGAKQGQAGVKLVFDVADVPAFCAARAEHGLHFGPLHTADGYVFANAKDPCGNGVSVSGRGLRQTR